MFGNNQKAFGADLKNILMEMSLFLTPSQLYALRRKKIQNFNLNGLDFMLILSFNSHPGVVAENLERTSPSWPLFQVKLVWGPRTAKRLGLIFV